MSFVRPQTMPRRVAIEALQKHCLFRVAPFEGIDAKGPRHWLSFCCNRCTEKTAINRNAP